MRERRRRPAVPDDPITGSSSAEKKAASSPATSAENLVVGASILSVLLSIVITVKFITPLLLTAAVVPFFLHAMRRGLHGRAVRLTARWAVTVFVCVVIAGGFVSARAERTFPYAGQSVNAIEDWIAGTADTPPADFKLLLGGGLAFAVAAVVSGGILGFILASLVLASSACGSAFLFQQGDNIFHIALIAIQPWLLCFFAAGVFFIVPAAFPVQQRFLNQSTTNLDRTLLRFIYVGAGLFLLSIVLRLTTAGAWKVLTERWTIS
jgi:hypothetical protein